MLLKSAVVCFTLWFCSDAVCNVQQNKYSLFLAVLLQFIMTAVSVALPIPAGVFFPVFLIGKGLFSWFVTLIVVNLLQMSAPFAVIGCTKQ